MALLVLVYIIGSASHGSTRWIYIGAFGFQPVGICKACADRIYRRYLYQKTQKPEYTEGSAKMLLLPFGNDHTDRDRELKYRDHMLWHCCDHCICRQSEKMAVCADGADRNPDVRDIYCNSRLSMQIVSVSGLHRKNTMMDTRRCSPFMRSDPEAFLEEALGTVSRRWDLYQSPIMT